jgi:hypothetical protein
MRAAPEVIIGLKRGADFRWRAGGDKDQLSAPLKEHAQWRAGASKMAPWLAAFRIGERE